MKRIFLLATCFFTIFSTFSQAELMSVTPPDNASIKENSEVNVYFVGEITPQKIIELGTTLDGINVQYASIKGINLYINSGGGDMDAGHVGYWMIRSSRIPVRTINLSYVGSAATLLFCAGKQRDAMSGSQFLIHPAATKFDKGYYKPDELERKQRSVNESNQIFRDVYKDCTTLSDSEVTSIFKSEYFSRSMTAKEALDIGMATELTNAIRPPAGSGYVFSKDTD
ncbi:ATP-dependent Clp protease proteolytic subunit [Brucella rhizosphaerae]|nr:ATP-dependent Clp protease proteolytic subunit [Brucella rhizosphaerae]